MKSVGLPSAPAPLVGGPVACATCGQMMSAGTLVQDVAVYRLGALDSIEIHHTTCLTRQTPQQEHP